jgi:alkylhydroperoxidase family enzyme
LRVENGDPELVQAIQERRWRELDTLSPRLRALLLVAEKLSGTPTRMVEGDWKPLRDLGFDDRGCLEVAHVVGIFNYLTRLADGFGLQLDPQTLAASQTGRALNRPADLPPGT